MRIQFTKMHGLGNDFVIVDARGLKIKWERLASRLLHRRFGIGADQLLLLEESQRGDFRMRIFNPDGSEVEMCGNGIRCLANYIWKNGLSSKSTLEIETPAGIIRPEKVGDMVRVDMGRPRLRPEEIPVNISGEELIIDYPIKIKERTFYITCVSMGNPHAVIMEEDLEGLDLALYGPLIENHPLFPRRTNVEFVRMESPGVHRGEHSFPPVRPPLGGDLFKVRVWERGAGETLACGTGASAVAVAMKLKGLGGERQRIILPGGELLIELKIRDSSIERVFMTGPAVEVFKGEIDIEEEIL